MPDQSSAINMWVKECGSDSICRDSFNNLLSVYFLRIWAGYALMPQLWMVTLCFYCLQLHHLHHPAFYSPTSKTALKTMLVTNRYPIVSLRKSPTWGMNGSFFFLPFCVNKFGVQPTVIAQAYWNHRLSAFTQAAICIRLFAFVCPLWHVLLSHKAAAIIWEWKGPQGMPLRATRVYHSD